MPVQGELRLWLSTLFTTFLSGRLFTFFALFLLLFIEALELVAILKDPLALALWLVVCETAFIESSVGVDPLSLRDLAYFPLSVDLHTV